MIALPNTVDSCPECGYAYEAEPSDALGSFYEVCACSHCDHQWTQPRPQDDFLSCLADWYDAQAKPKERPVVTDTTPANKIELTDAQKRAIVTYLLNYGKGVAEDVDELWVGRDPDTDYDAVTTAAEDFIQAARERLLADLS